MSVATIEAPIAWRRATLLDAAYRAFTRSRSRAVGLLIVAGFGLMAALGPFLYPARLATNADLIYSSPSLAHPLGTDFEGTDVLALIVTGARYVLLAALIAALIHVVIGTAVGLSAGYSRGFANPALMRVTDVALTVPTFPLLVVLSTVWSFGSPWAMGLVLGVTGWGGLARAVRSQTLSLRERPFVEAARALGLPARHVILREILPNVAPYIATSLLLSLTGAIYAEVGLFFLGVVPFTANNWGVMLNLAVFQGGALSTSQALPYLLSPLACILLLTLGIVLCLDAVEELCNPRLRTGR